MSLFCPSCCCTEVEGRAEYSLSLPAKTPLKKYFQKISKSMSFWRLKGCSRVVRGAFARNWLRFGARCEKAPAVGSVLAPDVRKHRQLAPFWRQKAKTKAGFSRVASIMMPCSEVESGSGINFDATKEISPDPYIFRLPMTYRISKFFSEAPIKTALLIPYLVRGFENILPEGLIFPLSRDLPLEGRFFSGDTRKNGASHS